MKYVGAVYCKF